MTLIAFAQESMFVSITKGAHAGEGNRDNKTKEERKGTGKQGTGDKPPGKTRGGIVYGSDERHPRRRRSKPEKTVDADTCHSPKESAPYKGTPGGHGMFLLQAEQRAGTSVSVHLKSRMQHSPSPPPLPPRRHDGSVQAYATDTHECLEQEKRTFRTFQWQWNATTMTKTKTTVCLGTQYFYTWFLPTFLGIKFTSPHSTLVFPPPGYTRRYQFFRMTGSRRRKLFFLCRQDVVDQ